jgi:hypothetical protein
VREDVLRALERVEKVPDAAGCLRLYHATSEVAAAAIIAEKALRPALPEDPAMRILAARDGGQVFLSSSPAIGGELGQPVVLAVDVDVSTPAEVLRDQYGDPPRVELQSDLPAGEMIALVSVERLDRNVEVNDLPQAARRAVELFAASPIGVKLRAHEAKAGNCQRASIAFLSALRECGTDGTLLAWTVGETAWHGAVMVAESGGLIVDWTAGQFEAHDAAVPYPRVETRARADARWGDSNPLDPDTPVGRSFGNVPAVPSWEHARLGAEISA